MDITNRETYGLLAVVLLLLIRHHPVDLAIQNFILRECVEGVCEYDFYNHSRCCICSIETVVCKLLAGQDVLGYFLVPRTGQVPGRFKQQSPRSLVEGKFRVSRVTFAYICRLVGPAIVRQNTRMGDAVPVEKRVAVNLWRLATGECYHSCGLMIGLANPTVVKCCHEFVEAICRLQDDFIKFLSTRAEISRKIEGLSEKSKVPNVVAVIDGSHIPIKALKENHEDYFNWKHFYSYLVQGIVDSSGLFLSVVTGFPGSLHVSRMLRLSDVYWAAENEDILIEPTLDLGGTIIRPLVVGDSVYPLKTWLLPVIKDNGALSRDQKKFNKELSKARIVSEHAFGLLKGRWRALLKRLDEDHWRTPNTIDHSMLCTS